MNTHIVRSASNFASRFPCRSFQFHPSHLHPHPPLSNEKISTRRNVAVWPARSVRPRLVIGLFIKGGERPSYPGCLDV
jgi:hypothetical protein